MSFYLKRELINHLNRDKFGSIARDALDVYGDAKISDVICAEADTEGQQSFAIASLYEFRVKAGYFKQHHFVGLEGTIDSLRERNVMVYLSTLETQRGLIAAWFAKKDDSLVGLIVGRFAF